MVVVVAVGVGGGLLSDFPAVHTAADFIVFFGLDSVTALKEMFAACTLNDGCCAYGNSAAVNLNFFFFFFVRPVNEAPAPGWSLSFQRGTQREAESTPAAGSRMTLPCVHSSLEIHKA